MGDFPRELAATELTRTSESRRTLLDEHSASFRWLMASFLAINSGGLLFLANSKVHNLRLYSVAGVSFYLGIIAALAVAWLGQRVNRRAIAPLSKLESYWALVSATGKFDQEEFDAVMAEVALTANPGMARYAGWLSVIAFSVGVFAIGVSSLAPLKCNSRHDLNTNVKPKHIERGPK